MHRLEWMALFCLAATLAAAQPARKSATETPGYDVAYIGPRMADPVMQHSKEAYVLFGCSYCHGLYLVARGEATDLMHSRLVGKDENANLMAPLLRAGIPQTAKLSPMPQFSDLSDQQITDIARWIHYARQQGRYQELEGAPDSSRGDADAGQVYFETACRSCHANDSLADVARKYDGKALRREILRPHALDVSPSFKLDRLRDNQAAAARQRHLALLENYTAQDVENVMAYLRTVK